MMTERQTASEMFDMNTIFTSLTARAVLCIHFYKLWDLNVLNCGFYILASEQ
jgi:hypothetical protein